MILAIAILLLSLLCQPAAAERDVKVALTDLKPTLFSDGQGKPAGFFVDIITDMAAQEGWNVIWVRGSLSESWARLASGEIDLLPGVASTPERQTLYEFSNESALSVWSQVYARPDSGISTILDLEGKRVASVKGALSGIAFLDYARRFGVNATLVEKSTPAEVFSATANRETDALVVYNTAGQEDAKTYGLAATPVMFSPTQFGFAVQKGRNRDLLVAADQYLAQGRGSPSSVYSQAMQKWFGIKRDTGIIPSYIWWGLTAIACIAGLFVVMNLILRREVRKKTAELRQQNENLEAEVAHRALAEAELTKKNQELHAAYEQLTSTEEELRQNYQELRQNEQELMRARKKLSLLNTLTLEDVRNAIFSLNGYIELAKQASSGMKAESFLGRSGEILHTIGNALDVAKKYQELGIHPPRWHNVNITLINALSHLDFSRIVRSVTLDDLEIYADPLLEDVFFILMQNVLIHGRGATEVRIAYHTGERGLTITIEDNGPGIPDEDKEKIFRREYQLSKEGTGLFLAREILSLTGITIAETGVQGTGARFVIGVPEGAYRVRGRR